MTADDRVPLVRRDDLQLARLAAEHGHRLHLVEQLRRGEVAGAAQADFLAERPEQPEGPFAGLPDQAPRQVEEPFGEHLPDRMPSFPAMEQPKAMPFVMDMKEIQRRAREHVEKGAVTPAYRGNLETAINLLNEALATEIICTLRYR